MVPAAIVVLDALPLTPNGKIDRASLPEPPAPDTSSYRAPRDTVERTLCALFGDVLATADVGIDDSFFDLNGDSLLATRLLSRIRTELGFDLTIADLFNQPTVAELRGHIGARGENAA
jgi:acyl carrier protein